MNTHPNTVSSLADLTLSCAAELVRSQAVSPVELAQACLDRIQGANADVRAFITITAESALAAARIAESEIRHGQYRGRLHGIPLALKDLLDTAGVRTTAASELFVERVPAEDATVVRKLKQAGAVLLGKTNLHEFAYGCSSVIGNFGVVQNPRKPGYIAGGSSSGSAAALAAKMCFGAIGTDTAGSIRLPAAYCGVVGLKPTYGRVSAHGVVPLSWSYDHVGPMARTVEDAALLLEAIAGYDPLDKASADVPAFEFASVGAITGRLRVGVARQFFFDGIHPEIASAVDRAFRAIAPIAELREVVVPVSNDRTVQSYEAYLYHREWAAQSPERYQPETLRRIQSGARYTVDEYDQALRELRSLRAAVADLFREVDVIVTPTAAVPPPTIAELQSEPGQLRQRELLMLRNTRPFNVLGLPTISISCGETAEGLPIGLQITGAAWQEATVLSFAKAVEAALA
ncbi:MAG TPA: amidase [Clostridia bacterium]|nr:amidase [Clostridia bacterium]